MTSLPSIRNIPAWRLPFPFSLSPPLPPLFLSLHFRNPVVEYPIHEPLHHTPPLNDDPNKKVDCKVSQFSLRRRIILRRFLWIKLFFALSKWIYVKVCVSKLGIGFGLFEVKSRTNKSFTEYFFFLLWTEVANENVWEFALATRECYRLDENVQRRGGGEKGVVVDRRGGGSIERTEEKWGCFEVREDQKTRWIPTWLLWITMARSSCYIQVCGTKKTSRGIIPNSMFFGIFHKVFLNVFMNFKSFGKINVSSLWIAQKKIKVVKDTCLT